MPTVKGSVLSVEHRKKISEGMCGRTLSAVHKQHLSESKKGRVKGPLPGVVRSKISAVLKEKYANGWPPRRTYGLVPANKGKRSPVIKNDKEYSPFWKEIRLKVYARDGYLCQECGKKCAGKGRDPKTLIQCHHIDYDVTNNALSNLITLCSVCHAKTNFKKEGWIKHFKEKQWQIQ